MARKAKATRRAVPSTDKIDPTMPPVILTDFAASLGKVDKDYVFTIKAPITLPVVKPDKGFRTATINGGDEFTFDRARLGAKNQVILCFKPMDPTLFVEAEVDEGKIADVFPEFAIVAREAFKNMTDVATFSALKKRWIDRETHLRTLEAEADEKAKADDLIEGYGDNPTYGMF